MQGESNISGKIRHHYPPLLLNKGGLPAPLHYAVTCRSGSSAAAQAATLDHDKTLLQRQIEATDAAIDALVYELYGLTEEEIKNVDGRP